MRVSVRHDLLEHEVTKALRRGNRVLDWSLHHDMSCDYRCGRASILLYQYQSLESVAVRQTLITRLQQLGEKLRGGGGSTISTLIVWVDTATPSAECLSWINLECGLAFACSVVFCWTVEEISQFLESMTTASPSAIDFRGGGSNTNQQQPDTSTPLPALIEAFTQTPQLLTRNDVVRIANRASSVAELLSSEPDTYHTIPGFGPKKALRFHTLLNTPFMTNSTAVEAFVASTKQTAQGGDRSDEAVPSAVELVLERIRMQEDADRDDDDD